MSNLGDFFLGLAFWLLLMVFIFNLISDKTQPNAQDTTLKLQNQIEDLQQQCKRLREELKQQSQWQDNDLKQAAFEELKSLLINYPTVCQIVQNKPDLPAKNLVALFTPLDNLLESWNYEVIGHPWQQVKYNPQYHQPDDDEIQEGELVYIRFVGYKQGNNILVPAKVSRYLPEGNAPSYN